MLRTVCLSLFLAAGAASARAQATGVLRVESVPAQAFVQVDSLRVGPTPAEVAVAPGPRRVRVRVYYAGYDPLDRVVVVPAGEVVAVRAVLVRQTGVVTFSGLPPGAVATIDGATTDGATGGGPTSVPTGDVRVRVDVPERRPAEAVVRVVARGETAVRYGLRVLDAPTAALAVFAPGAV